MKFSRIEQPHAKAAQRLAAIIALVAAYGLQTSVFVHAQDDHDHGNHEEEHDEHASEDEHGHEEGHVNVAPEVLREFDIQLGEVGAGELHEEVVLPGEIKFNREQLAYATPRYQGTVQEIRVRLADQVSQGQVLATLENTTTLNPFEIKAPFGGVIVAYDITPGQTVEAGAPLFTVADLSTVWADLQVYQRNTATIKEGQNVVIIGEHDSKTYRGTVAYIAPSIDEHTRTGLARVVVDNEKRLWKPGEFIRGRVSIEEHPVEVLLPRSAVLTMEGSKVVFVQTDEGFEPRPVELGHSDSEAFEVIDGLRPGEVIALRNAISLKAEMGKGSFGGHQH